MKGREGGGGRVSETAARNNGAGGQMYVWAVRQLQLLESRATGERKSIGVVMDL